MQIINRSYKKWTDSVDFVSLTYSKNKYIMRKVSFLNPMRPRTLIFDSVFGRVKALLPHNTRLHNQNIWQQINGNKLWKVFRLFLKLHIYGLVGVVTSIWDCSNILGKFWRWSHIGLQKRKMSLFTSAVQCGTAGVKSCVFFCCSPHWDHPENL